MKSYTLSCKKEEANTVKRELYSPKTSIVVGAMIGENAKWKVNLGNKIWGWKVQLPISKLVFSLSDQFLWTGQLLKELAVKSPP